MDQLEADCATAAPSGSADANILEQSPNHIGRVVLAVRDLDAMAHFYQHAIGLVPLGRDEHGLHLGAGGRVLLSLRHEPAAAVAEHDSAGLYHLAFLLPEPSDLGAWLGHAQETAIRIDGASDHLVSEAIYLADPEGNGVEIYADRPSSTWYRPGRVPKMSTARLDVAGLLRAAVGRKWTGMPAAGRVGHVHLRVGDTGVADAFYADLLGFDRNPFAPAAHFYSTGGYHHQIAANSWQSGGAGPRRQGTTGLVEMQVAYRDARTFDQVRARLAAAKSAIHLDGRDLVIEDPYGIAVRLTPPEHEDAGQ